jgi:glycogen operon protein
MLPGNPELLGATPDESGTNFAVYSAVAESVEVCLFPQEGHHKSVFRLPECTGGVWHGFLPGCEAGQLYGYRVHGPYDPWNGLRCNPSKLLIDPYAREISGDFQWHPAIFDYTRDEDGELDISEEDSAPYVPKSVVRDRRIGPVPAGPRIPWVDTVFYECNVRGFTMRHPAIDEAQRGTFDGMRHKDILAHLKALGVTSVELMPVHAFVDEHHLVELGLTNFWGYNSISFFAPTLRYSRQDGITEFQDMVRALHDAGFEVILDVVYNHTGEGGYLGPTLGFRGIDNRTYYRTEPQHHGIYVNDTGCGNTLNVDHIRVRKLILDSLDYWATDMGVDGFRFDLAPILGRRPDGFSETHPLLMDISNLPSLKDKKLIAEPWDPGPNGYQLGSFPPRWAEWNDRFRDSVRQFWRGDEGKSGELAQRLHGSADIFESSRRRPSASINFVTTHDGFTLLDTVSYEHRHNEANGENNTDGHSHNFSSNYGVEGPTDDEAINTVRRRQRLNMLATLLLSQGTPLLLAGDEFGHTQGGNNNGYAQDNDTGWLDWSSLDSDPDFFAEVCKLLRLRHDNRLLKINDYVHGVLERDGSTIGIHWINVDGESKQSDEWAWSRAFTVLIEEFPPEEDRKAVAIVINGDTEDQQLKLPDSEAPNPWKVTYSTGGDDGISIDGVDVNLPGLSLALLECG